MKYDIFISYRRDGGDTLAQLIYDRLTSRGYRVFLDIESLRSGKFNEKLLNVIEECNDVVVILPPNALDRCKNPGDWLFCEVSHAIKCHKNLVPVMMHGFTWPEKMPEGMEELANYNGITDSKNYFDAVIDKLTLLLVSKPTFLKGFARKNVFLNKVSKPKQPIEKNNLGMKKWILTVVALVAVLCICFTQQSKKQKSEITESAEDFVVEENLQMEQSIEDDSVTIVLKAGEDMSVADFQKATEVIEKRVQILAKGSAYEYQVEGGQIVLQLPKDILGKGNIEGMVKSYLSRPVYLYVMSEDMTQGFLPVFQEDIVDITLKQGEITFADTKEEYGFEAGEENTYFHIVFTEELNQKIREKYGQKDSYLLVQDYEKHPSNAYGYYLFKADSEEGYYFADENQMANINELVLHNYQQNTFPQAMLIDIRYHIEWEDIAEKENRGIHQCNAEDMQGEQMVIYYQPSYAKEVTKGERVDCNAAFKKRLDALGVPYAMGDIKENENGVAVKIGIQNIGGSILELLGSSVSVAAMYHPYTYLDVVDAKLEVLPKEDGTYALGYTNIGEWYVENLREDFAAIRKSSNTNLYLATGMFDSFILSKMDVETALAQLDKGQILFDNLIGWGAEVLTEENKYLADYVVAFTNHDMPVNYEISGYYFENMENSSFSTADLPVKNKYLADKMVEYLKKVWEKYSEVEFLSGDNYEFAIKMELPLDEKTAQTMIDIVKDLYHNCGLHEGEVEYSVLFYQTENAMMKLNISVGNSVSGGQTFMLAYSGDEVKPCVEEFEKLIQQDDFFKTYMQPNFERGVFDVSIE